MTAELFSRTTGFDVLRDDATAGLADVFRDGTLLPSADVDVIGLRYAEWLSARSSQRASSRLARLRWGTTPGPRRPTARTRDFRRRLWENGNRGEEEVMAFQGEVRPIGALLERAQNAPTYEPRAGIGVHHTAADNAARCAVLLAAGDTPEARWRFSILQTLDDYTSTRRRGGTALAAQVFAAEPAPTGSTRLDAAFAALADHLAERDGWQAPAWAPGPERRADGWYPAVSAIFRAEAERDSPRAFRERGIVITRRSLDRA